MKQSRYFFVIFLLVSIFIQTGYAGRYFSSNCARWTTPDPMQQKYPGWSPYCYGMDNPIKNIDVDGKEVHVYTERLGSASLYNNVTGALDFAKRSAVWLYGPLHTFMRVTTDKVDVLIELGGPANGSKTGNPLMEPLGKEMQTRPGQEEETVNRPQGVGEKDYKGFENKILNIFDAIKSDLPDYDALNGPNSNGFIRFLIEAAGGGVNLPDKAWKNEEIKKYWEQYQKTLAEQRKQEQEKQQQQGSQQ